MAAVHKPVAPHTAVIRLLTLRLRQYRLQFLM
jgi:hypothetical protein